MARENQGLQIALIIFVMLTIILGVTTFLFFRTAEQTNEQLRDVAKKCEGRRRRRGRNWTSASSTRQLMGYAPDLEKDSIQNDFVKQMTPFEALCPKKPDGSRRHRSRTRRRAEEYFPSFAIVRAAQTKELADCQDLLAKKRPTRTSSRPTTRSARRPRQPEIDSLTAARDAAVKQAAAEKGEFDKDRERFKGDQDTFAKTCRPPATKAQRQSRRRTTDLATETDRWRSSTRTTRRLRRSSTPSAARRRAPCRHTSSPVT